MCEKRMKKIRKESQITRLREVRRLQRLQRITLPNVSPQEGSSAPPPSPYYPVPVHIVDKAAQTRVILELALKTIALMHKNTLIQQKIVALQKETSEFVAAAMSDPEYKRRYIENARQYRLAQQAQMQVNQNNVVLKIEPK